MYRANIKVINQYVTHVLEKLKIKVSLQAIQNMKNINLKDKIAKI